jgi:Ca2+-binding EF-hand superfamily protein
VDVAWKVFDKDLDGYISKVEFQRMASKNNVSRYLSIVRFEKIGDTHNILYCISFLMRTEP